MAQLLAAAGGENGGIRDGAKIGVIGDTQLCKAGRQTNFLDERGQRVDTGSSRLLNAALGCDTPDILRKPCKPRRAGLVDMAGGRAGISRDSFLDSEEMLDKNADRLLKSFGYGSSTQFYSDKAVKAQVDIIRDLANKRVSAIFFGRCADYVLREYPNHMNVFLYAPLEARIKHMCETYDLSWPEADKLIKRVDRQRHNYYKYVTGKNRGDRDNKHLMIDVSEYGTDLTAEMICFAARKMFED